MGFETMRNQPVDSETETDAVPPRVPWYAIEDKDEEEFKAPWEQWLLRMVRYTDLPKEDREIVDNFLTLEREDRLSSWSHREMRKQAA